MKKSLEKFARKQLISSGFNARALFDFGDDGCVHIDGTQGMLDISTENKEADVTLSTSLETFSKILNGESDPHIAFMMEKLKIRGSMRLALKQNAFLED